MPVVGFGLSLDGGVIIAGFKLEGEDDATIIVFILLTFRDRDTGCIGETAFHSPFKYEIVSVWFKDPFLTAQ